MAVNGFGYKNYPTTKVLRDANTIVTSLTDGQFEIEFADGSKSLFTPLQFHWHAPSEHTVEGNVYDLELHIVHYYKDQPSSLGAYIAIFFDRKVGGNYSNPLLESLRFSDSVDGQAVTV